MTPLIMVLVELVLKSSIILGCTFTATLFLRRQSAALRHMVWTAGLICALTLPFFSAVVPAWYLAPAMAAEASVRVTAPPKVAAEGRTAVSIPEATTPPPPSRITPQRAGFFVWLAGTLWIASLLLREGIRLARVAFGAGAVDQSSWCELARDVSRALQLTRRVRLLRNSNASVLGTWGALRPRVLLPRESESWSGERIRVVLGHELAHVKRNDWLLQLVAEFARAIYWFNPLFWLACSRLRRESEHACDDAAMLIGGNSGIDGPTYAAHVLELARSLKLSGQAGSVALAMASSSNLERRLIAMLNPSLNRSLTSKRTAAVVILLALGLTIPLAAMQSSAPPVAAVTVSRAAEFVPLIPIAPGTAISSTPRTVGAVSVRRAVPVEIVLTARRQSPTGALSGTVADPSGAMIPGAIVKMTVQSTGQVQQRFTDGSGAFSFAQLSPDNYAITVELPGFQQGKFSYVLSNPGSNARVRFPLQLAPLNLAVDISEHAPPGIRCFSVFGAFKADGTPFTEADCPGGTIVTAGAARPAVQPPVATSNAVIVADTVQQPALQPNGRPPLIRVGGDLQQASAVSHPNPAYPAEARSKVVQGVVTVTGIIAKDGSLQSLKIIGSSNPLLESAVLETLQTWTFRPTLLNRQPLETMVTVTVNFKLVP